MAQQHTLEECPSWEEKRRVLINVIGEDLSLSTIAKKMVESEEVWEAVVSFCVKAMTQKEKAERARERERAEDNDDGNGSQTQTQREKIRRPRCRQQQNS